MKATTPDVAASPTGLTHKQILTILGGLLAGVLLAALDQTIVATSIRTIADDLGNLSGQAWATTAYLITSTITTPLYGKLSDIYGRRPLFLAAISIFVLGSIASGFATSMDQLAVFRGVQGVGAGGLMSLALAILADIVSPRERARYQGYFLAVFGTSSVLGPIVGGFFAGANSIFGITGWRWVFLINVPIGIIALVVVMKVLHIPHTRRNHRIDWYGAAALVIGMVPLLLVAEEGNKWGWTSVATLSMIALGIAGIAAFVVIEMKMGDDALIPTRLFKNGSFSLALVINLAIGLAMFGALACLPLYLQLVKGATPTESGLWLLPLMLGLMGGSLGSGIATSKTGRYKIFPLAGTAILVGAFALILTLTPTTPFPMLALMFFLVGLGLGLNMQTMVMAVQNVVPARDIGVATSSATFFRGTGGTIGTAVFLSLLFNGLPENVATKVAAASKTPEFQAALAASGETPAEYGAKLANLGNDSQFLNTLDPTLAQPIKDGFVQSTHIVYILAGCVAVLAFLLVLKMKEVPLRTKSALQERQEEEAASAAEAAAGAVALGGELAMDNSDAVAESDRVRAGSVGVMTKLDKNEL
ncbi:DHA2 family efflux MFS transporter permease subunit [Nakamurella antarctica]|uniref:DHA2 family efflux MFS transporter permease subunit n=1 Tax=Nakamurella antarctica TaxID=1902245 RepID=A0A3G8ZRP9_9ACTN|nr:MDR family MFS transporter [Nakamurella antarctica]AZI57174.1 DHA2 family efflux MFS transporter permease subunit [Nakamurella antarctica]